MEVMSRTDEQLFEKLVRLAGGNSGIVMHALARAPRRHGDSGVDLKEVVHEIEFERERQRLLAVVAAVHE